MKIAVSGASGLVGKLLTKRLTALGHTTVPLVRKSPAPGQILWNPESGEVDIAALSQVDGVVHLAGENIAGGRWTPALKKRILESRTVGTRVLCEALAKCQPRPKVLVCASAVGFYGDRGSEAVDESAKPGQGFLSDVCAGWEAACDPARQAGLRVVNLRIGVVLSRDGGALAKMLLPFKLGMGGVVGSGNQYWSWVAIDDVVGAAVHCLTNEQVAGPVNAVAPHSVDNREFTKTLGRVLGRPTIFPMPAFAARLALGEMADELLLASIRVQPKALLDSGYAFQLPELEAALQHVL